MAVVKLEDLRPGMMLAGDAMLQDGRALLRAGAVLTAKNIATLKAWGLAGAECGDAAAPPQAGDAAAPSGGARCQDDAPAAPLLTQTAECLRQSFEFRAAAFMTVGAELDFQLQCCTPPAAWGEVTAEIERQIERGSFAAALRDGRAYTADARCGVLLQALAAYGAVRGMFVGIRAPDGAPPCADPAHPLSVLLRTTAAALESDELERRIAELERLAAARAAELETARAAAESADLAKGRFLANMSHEIRTPLASVIGFAECLQDQDLSPQEQVDAIATIILTGRHLLDVLTDLLDLAKIESDRLEVVQAPVPLFEALTEVERLLRAQAAAKGLDFVLDYRYPVPRRIITDPARLRQILLNLGANAVKFTAQGGVCLEVSGAPERGQVSFSVADTGIGIGAQEQAQLFRSFSQADASPTRRFGGAGIGLYVAKRLAEKLGGEITVDSMPGAGSRFTAVVGTGPLADDDWLYEDQPLPSAMPLERRRKGPPHARLSGRVLLAEDNPFNQRLVTLQARRLGLEIETVGNGKQAVERALVEDFDLILMDMQMPEMDGLEATRWLRRAGYGRPVVAVTANVSQQDRDLCLAAGCNDFVTKPIDQGRFSQLLSKYLKGAEEAQRGSGLGLEQDSEFQAILAQFRDELPGRIAAMEAACAAAHWDELRSLAHQLKGSAGGYGFAALGAAAAGVEHEIMQDRRDRVPACMGRLAAEFAALPPRAGGARHEGEGP